MKSFLLKVFNVIIINECDDTLYINNNYLMYVQKCLDILIILIVDEIKLFLL